MKHYEFFHLHWLGWETSIHKPRKETIHVCHINLQFENFYFCQHIKW
jgi:hypothetical protein